jgi:hypothetical protein
VRERGLEGGREEKEGLVDLYSMDGILRLV